MKLLPLIHSNKNKRVPYIDTYDGYDITRKNNRVYIVDGRNRIEITNILSRRLTVQFYCRSCNIHCVEYSTSQTTSRCNVCKRDDSNIKSRDRHRVKSGCQTRDRNINSKHRKRVASKLRQSAINTVNHKLTKVVFIVNRDNDCYRSTTKNEEIPLYRRENGLAESQFYGKTIRGTCILYINTNGIVESASTYKITGSKFNTCQCCKEIKDSSFFSNAKRTCRQCVAIRKQEYRKTYGYKHSADRRMRRIGITSDGTITNKAIKDMANSQNNKYNICRTGIANGFHKDHIVPISKAGLHTISNIQLLCESCNLKKGNKLYVRVEV